jgi:tetratricopeptide (TPR) repeat protein
VEADAYMRGEAYLAADQVAEAIPEFQKILDHRGIVLADPLGALAHLQLGRAFALSGDKVKAKAAYQDFLTMGEELARVSPYRWPPLLRLRGHSRLRLPY